MTETTPEEKWQVRIIRPGLPGLGGLQDLGLPDLSRLPFMNQPVRPAEIGGALREAMLARENMLEDVNYLKVVPNRFVVEVSQANYARQFRPIEGQLIRQWSDRLLEDLITANSRRGRKELRLGGPVRIEVRSANDLKDAEARILSRIDQAPPARPQVDVPASAKPRVAPPRSPSRPARPEALHRLGEPTGAMGAPIASAYLEMVPSAQRWAIYPGVNTIGRSESAQVFLDERQVQERRLVSGLHAYIVMENGQCILYDGSPDGRPSANGTYVNLRRVPPQGYRLQNGDAIVLAAVDPLYPRSDTPGVATLYFWAQRKA